MFGFFVTSVLLPSVPSVGRTPGRRDPLVALSLRVEVVVNDDEEVIDRGVTRLKALPNLVESSKGSGRTSGRTVLVLLADVPHDLR